MKIVINDAVVSFIGHQPIKVRKKMTFLFDKLEEHGLQKLLQSGDIKKMHGYEKYKLFELRLRFNKICYRLFFTTYNQIAWIVHGIKKKGAKTPTRDIKRSIELIKRIGET